MRKISKCIINFKQHFSYKINFLNCILKHCNYKGIFFFFSNCNLRILKIKIKMNSIEKLYY